MLTIKKPADNRLDIELEGVLDAELMAAGLDDLIAQSEGIVNGKMLYRIPEFGLPTAGAIGVELTRLPKLLALIPRFDRCAVLSDASWIRTAAEIEGALIPGLAIKAFELDELETAEAWLDEL
ncbi:MAG: STAS/SEC14 domain-containing protein [Pseudomonadota bacterium]